ncbi:MAG: hypothetical protein GY726_12120 [Proteobacteria bacterium]|nr:hypothetical protein [Pseudomonadota bacterium]
MSEALRILVNFLITAALSIGAAELNFRVDEWLFRNVGGALFFFSEHYSSDTYMFAVWIYDAFRLFAYGAIVALLMLLLKPRRIVLYGIASIAPQAWLFGSITVILNESIHHSSLSLISLLTIPLLYWIFSRISENRHNKAFKTDGTCQ